MTPTEAVDLVAYVAACCPSMRMEPGTPDAWYRLMSDLDLTDCLTAVDTLAKAKPYIAVSDIRDQVRALREARIDRAGRHLALAPPPADAHDYGRQLRARITELADRRDLTRAIDAPPRRGCPPELRDAAAKVRVAALDVTCPHCEATVGEWCHVPNTDRRPAGGVHAARVKTLTDRGATT